MVVGPKPKPTPVPKWRLPGMRPQGWYMWFDIEQSAFGPFETEAELTNHMVACKKSWMKGGVEVGRGHVTEFGDALDWNATLERGKVVIERDETQIAVNVSAYWGERIRALAFSINGVACSACQGFGRLTYEHTTTWRRAGDQSSTEDVCDSCWGTGRTDQEGTDLREVEARLERASARLREIETRVVGIGHHLVYFPQDHKLECAHCGFAWDSHRSDDQLCPGRSADGTVSPESWEKYGSPESRFKPVGSWWVPE